MLRESVSFFCQDQYFSVDRSVRERFYTEVTHSGKHLDISVFPDMYT